MNYVKSIVFLLGPRLNRVPLLLFLFLVTAFLEVIGIGMVVPFVALIFSPDSGLAHPVNYLIGDMSDDEAIPLLCFILVALFFLKGALGVAVQWLIIKFTTDHMCFLRTTLMANYLNSSYEDYLRGNSADNTFTMTSLTATYCSRVLLPALRVISDGIMVLAILGLLVYSAPEVLFVLGVVLFLCILIYDLVFKTKLQRYGLLRNSAATNVIKVLNEGVRGLRETRVLRLESSVLKELTQQAYLFSRYEAIATTLKLTPKYAMEAVLVSFVALLVLYSQSSSWDDEELASIITVFALAIVRLLPTVNSLISNLMALRLNRNGVDRLYKSLNGVNLEVDAENFFTRQETDKPFRGLRVEALSYKYPESNVRALSDVSFEIKAGSAVGIIGSSGSGKTTLANLLLGLLTPTKGSLTYKGVNPQLEQPSSFQSIAYVPQDSFVKDDTLRANITLMPSAAAVDDEWLLQCIFQAELGDWYAQQPNGLQTRLGEGGALLSGGQKQRIAIARALFHKKDIIVFDESTSALDAKTERQIINQLSRLTPDRTLIMIAHRTQALSFCDLVLKLENGKLIKHGSYQRVIGLPEQNERDF